MSASFRRLAKTPGRIEFLSYGPTDSPPVALHPTFGGHDSSIPSVTQLPLAFNQSSVWLSGISPPFQMCFRAHECGSASCRFESRAEKRWPAPPQSKALRAKCYRKRKLDGLFATRSAGGSETRSDS